MHNFRVRLAGRVIDVSAIYESTAEFCGDYITDEADVDLSVSVDMADILSEELKAKRERELEGLPPMKLAPEQLELLALYRKIAEGLVDFNIILFHGSAVALDGRAYLFTAKSGTGKSTHTGLWRKTFGERAVMVNDDKPLIEILDTGAVIYGTPWNGKHRLGNNISAPLEAICILERDTENHIEAESVMGAFPNVLSQTYRFADKEKMRKTLALLDKMLRKIKLFRLGCNMEPEAAYVSYNGMKGNDNEA